MSGNPPPRQWVADRAQQRVHLFLGGARIDSALIRRDLHHLFLRSAKRISRQYGTEYLGRSDRTPPKLQAEARLIVDPALLESFLAGFGAQVPSDVASNLREVMHSPAAAQIVELVLQQTVLPDVGGALPKLRSAVAHLPGRAAEIVAGELDESIKTLAGILAHPDIGNAIVQSLARLGDEDLVVVRDYVLAWPSMIHGLKEVMAALPNDPDAASIAAVAGLLSHFASALSLENRLMMFGYFIARAGVIPSFMPAARASNKMRPGPVLREMARRNLLSRGGTRQQHEDTLAAAGVAFENWHFWLDPPAPSPPRGR